MRRDVAHCETGPSKPEKTPAGTDGRAELVQRDGLAHVRDADHGNEAQTRRHAKILRTPPSQRQRPARLSSR